MPAKVSKINFEITWECPNCEAVNTTTFSDGPTQCPYICEEWKDADGFTRRGVMEYDWNQLLTDEQLLQIHIRWLQAGNELCNDGDRANAVIAVTKSLADVMRIPYFELDNDGIQVLYLGEKPEGDPEYMTYEQSEQLVSVSSTGLRHFSVIPAPKPIDPIDYREYVTFAHISDAALCALKVYAELHPNVK